MPRAQLAWILLALGAVLCVPGAVVAALFVGTLSDANDLRSASICSTGTFDPASTCLSLFNGTATAWTPHSRSLDRVTIVLPNTTEEVGYSCDFSPARACGGISFKPGAALVTGWWKGQLVSIGPAESRPAVVTDQSPEYQLHLRGILLVLAIPGISLVLAGLLLWQAPSTVDAVVKTVLARYTNPPRRVDLRLLWRVTLAYSTYGGYIVWPFLYIFGSVALLNSGAYRLAPLILAASFVFTVGLAFLLAPVGLSDILRTSDRRTIVVKRFATGTSRNGTYTKVWYDRPDGTAAKTNLGSSWTGHINEGDRLDALTDKSGSILRLVSGPPGQA